MNSNFSIEDKYKFIRRFLLESNEKDPFKLLFKLMDNQLINMHGPEHHFLDGGALLTAMFNEGYEFDLDRGLDMLAERSIKMPGAMCGHWGVCGSVASIGAVLSIIDGTGPLSDDENYSKHMR